MNPPEMLALMFLITGGAYVFGPIARALAKRIAGDVPRRQLDETQALQEELATLRQEVAELAERVDFTERLLAKQQDVARIDRPR